jgi:hypothetical protein
MIRGKDNYFAFEENRNARDPASPPIASDAGQHDPASIDSSVSVLRFCFLPLVRGRAEQVILRVP